MQALVLERIGRLAVADRPIPVPGPHDVLIAVAAAGICGSDLHGYSGENGRRQPGQVMGHEASGVVVALGDEVSEASPGTAVTFNPTLSCGDCEQCRAGENQRCSQRQVIGVNPQRDAAYADLIAVPAGNVHPLPPGLAVELGALIEPIAVAVHALRRAATTPADRLLVVGGGPIGQSIVVAARAMGQQRIVVSEPDPGRRALCAALGAAVIDPAAGAVADAVQTEFGDPATVAIDAVGVSTSLADSLASTSAGGRVVLVGMGAPQLSLAAFDVTTAERSVLGSFAYGADDFAHAVQAAGALGEGLRRLVSDVVPASEADAAFQRLLASPPPGKVLLSFPL